MAITDKDLAGDDLPASYSPTPLFAGDMDVITEEGVVITGQNLGKYAVVGKITASGKLTALNPAAADGSEKAYGILSQAANATAADIRVGVYIGGFFNDAALAWPVHASLDTLIERKAAFAGNSMIRIGTVRK